MKYKSRRDKSDNGWLEEGARGQVCSPWGTRKGGPIRKTWPECGMQKVDGSLIQQDYIGIMLFTSHMTYLAPACLKRLAHSIGL